MRNPALPLSIRQWHAGDGLAKRVRARRQPFAEMTTSEREAWDEALRQARQIVLEAADPVAAVAAIDALVSNGPRGVA